jgi:hypothetical protein
MLNYIFQIVPNSLFYATYHGNVHKGYKMLGNVPLYFSILIILFTKEANFKKTQVSL